MVKHIRDVFSEVHDSVGGHLQGAMQNNAETSCVVKYSPYTEIWCFYKIFIRLSEADYLFPVRCVH